MARTRLDQLVVQHDLCESREKAQRLIRAGRVRVDGVLASKPGHTYATEARVTLEETARYVSRGGEKLEAAFAHFGLDVHGHTCMDIGASTGGFTDCLLQHGASRVYAVDVGKGQLHWQLRKDTRITVLEGINARYLEADLFDVRPTFGTIDVSFISLHLILPAVNPVLAPGGSLVTLIKPQFEAGPKQVGKGGVVRDAAIREEVIASVRAFGTEQLGMVWLGVCPSPITGPAGNIEFLALWRTSDA